MSRLLRLVILATVLAACGPTAGGEHAANVSPTLANASPTASIAPPTPSASATPALDCNLPFLTTDGRSRYTAVGFLKLPAGVFTPDANADSALPPGGVQGHPSDTSTQPWWDDPARRWIPVDLSAVSADGQRYAYMSSDGLHVVDVASGADTLSYQRPQGVHGGWVLGWLSDAVYVVIPTGVKDGFGGAITNPASQVGVWRIDRSTGTASRIFDSDSLGAMAAGALWSTGDTLTRVDIGSGQRTVWFKNPTQFMQFLGVDAAGLPVIWTFNGAGHLDVWHVTAPDQATTIYSLDYTGNAHIFGPEMQQGLFVADGHGVWFGAEDGVWLYDGVQFRKAASISGIPAGPCR